MRRMIRFQPTDNTHRSSDEAAAPRRIACRSAEGKPHRERIQGQDQEGPARQGQRIGTEPERRVGPAEQGQEVDARAVARVTFFTVQTVERRGKRLVTGQPRQFKTAAEALRNGERQSASSLRVVVLQIEGDPEFEDWGERKLLATHGEVPERD